MRKIFSRNRVILSERSESKDLSGDSSTMVGMTKILLGIFVALYILYFGILSVKRYQTLYASYYDLGIMHQTVFNTFRAIQTGDLSRVLEMTNTIGPEQIKRMAIHNDILLAFLSPFYFLNDSPATLLVIQTVMLAFGAVFVYKLARKLFEGRSYASLVALTFSTAWLFYPPIQRSNMFDFHAVVLSTTMLLGMYYFWLTKKYTWSMILFLLSVISKEQVGLTTMMFGCYAFITGVIPAKAGIQGFFKDPGSRIKSGMTEFRKKDPSGYRFSLAVISISLAWFILSVFVITPYFRGGNHFASVRYGEFGGSPSEILVGVVSGPVNVLGRFFRPAALTYYSDTLGALGYLSVLSPLHLLIVAPEYAVNLLSNSGGMRNIYFHYTAVLTPFIFIAAMYGLRNLLRYSSSEKQGDESRSRSSRLRFRSARTITIGFCIYMLIMTFWYSYQNSPIFYSKQRELHPIRYPQKQTTYVREWAEKLKDENIKVMGSGQLAPHLTNRRYFYTFSKYYPEAQYVIIRPSEIYNYPEKDELIPVYEQLVRDTRYKLIDKRDNFEVYKRQ